MLLKEYGDRLSDVTDASVTRGSPALSRRLDEPGVHGLVDGFDT